MNLHDDVQAERTLPQLLLQWGRPELLPAAVLVLAALVVHLRLRARRSGAEAAAGLRQARRRCKLEAVACERAAGGFLESAVQRHGLGDTAWEATRLALAAAAEARARFHKLDAVVSMLDTLLCSTDLLPLHVVAAVLDACAADEISPDDVFSAFGHAPLAVDVAQMTNHYIRSWQRAEEQQLYGQRRSGVRGARLASIAPPE